MQGGETVVSSGTITYKKKDRWKYVPDDNSGACITADMVNDLVRAIQQLYDSKQILTTVRFTASCLQYGGPTYLSALQKSTMRVHSK